MDYIKKAFGLLGDDADDEATVKRSESNALGMWEKLYLKEKALMNVDRQKLKDLLKKQPQLSPSAYTSQFLDVMKQYGQHADMLRLATRMKATIAKEAPSVEEFLKDVDIDPSLVKPRPPRVPTKDVVDRPQTPPEVPTDIPTRGDVKHELPSYSPTITRNIIPIAMLAGGAILLFYLL